MGEPAGKVETAAKKSAMDLVVGYFRDFNVLKETRSEYWGIQIVNFLDCTFYFAMLTVVSLFLSKEIGMDDKHAGYTITVFTTATTIFLFISGMVTDWLGIKRSLWMSMFAMLVLRLGVVVLGMVPTIPHRGIVATVLLFLMAPFMASIQTVFQSANARFTTKRSRSAGFNLWYLFMNIGAAAGGFLVDFEFKVMNLPRVHIFTAGAVTAVLCIIIALLTVRREDQLVGPGEAAEEKIETVKVARKNPFQIVREVVRESAFWKLVVLIMLILGVRAVFVYLYILMPKYWDRIIGPEAAIGTLNMINPIGIVIGLILFIPITNKFNIFSMLVYGSMVSAVSLFPMVLPWRMLSPDIVTAHYTMAILCMILLTIGEIIWSPKLNEYTAAIAPKGQEGTYLGLTMVPWFAAKMVVSVLSGHMLERWSPEKVPVDAAKLVEDSKRLGFGVKELAGSLGPEEVAEKAKAIGMNLADAARSLDMNAITAQAQQFGIDTAGFLSKFKAEEFTPLLKGYGIDLAALPKSLDIPALALKTKVVGMEVAQNVLSGNTKDIHSLGVSLQFAMINGWVDFWHSPAAMWLVLGIVAICGSLSALALRGWLTKGANWEIEEK